MDWQGVHFHSDGLAAGSTATFTTDPAPSGSNQYLGRVFCSSNGSFECTISNSLGVLGVVHTNGGAASPYEPEQGKTDVATELTSFTVACSNIGVAPADIKVTLWFNSRQ